MPRLTIKKGNEIKIVYFSGQPILQDVLVENGFYVPSPCGRKGTCGKCRVLISGEVSNSNEKEVAAGCRLACQARLLGDAWVDLDSSNEDMKIQVDSDNTSLLIKKESWKYGIAIDIGTTTIVLKLFSQKGEAIAEETATNPQRSVSADVIGRIDACLKGQDKLLQSQIRDCIQKLTKKACQKAGVLETAIEKAVVSGNTAMLYLLLGYSPKSIATAPFVSERLFGEHHRSCYIPKCMNAFVGADITCGILASGMCDSNEISLFCDIGTNGEIALWKDGILYNTSAAAGPCFEGAEISCGCGSVSGAIDKVWIDGGRIRASTIQNEPAVGICGSGLIDALAVFLNLGYINRNGEVLRPLILSANGGNIEITAQDVAAVQLAKSAIASAMEILIKYSETNPKDIKNLYIAGGFGNNLSFESAKRIGLIPFDFSGDLRFIGNSSLKGASMLLFDSREIEKSERIAKKSRHITLGGNEDFNSFFIKNMTF